jgi:hypothetical protein
LTTQLEKLTNNGVANFTDQVKMIYKHKEEGNLEGSTASTRSASEFQALLKGTLILGKATLSLAAYASEHKTYREKLPLEPVDSTLTDQSFIEVEI